MYLVHRAFQFIKKHSFHQHRKSRVQQSEEGAL